MKKRTRHCWFRSAILIVLLASATFAERARAAVTMNIEIDYMVSSGHSHRPQAAEIAAVVQMFACHGITLNIDVDDAIPHSNVLQRDPNNNNNFFGYSGVTNSFGALKNLYFDRDGQGGWHYCIFGHQYQDRNYATTGSSGLGQISGAFFIVTLGSFTDQIGTPFDRASTLAHEFGHNLGLGHGTVGDYQPNKPSIMSYFYQLRGVKTGMLDYGLTTSQTSLFKEMDYSDGTMCTLNESSLDEVRGTGMVSVDWNCSGTASGTVSRSIDDSGNWCSPGDTDRNVLTDVNEWATINDTTGLGPLAPKDPPMVECISREEMDNYLLVFGGKLAQPPVTSESCVNGRMIYCSPGPVVAGNGRCSNPYTSLNSANSGATSGSHVFMLPGTYTVPGTVVLNRRMTIFSKVGTSVVNPQ